MKYIKINSLYKRDKKRKILKGKYCDEVVESLKNFKWIGTEKIDGTNTRLIWTGASIEVKGKTDKGIITPYMKRATEKYLDVKKFKEVFSSTEAILFGESYGHNITSAGDGYLSVTNDFILFDVFINGFWLKRESVDCVAKNLGMKSVPTVFKGTLDQAEEFVSTGFKSLLADTEAEGLVLVPEYDLLKRNGDRIITKVKHKDYI